MPAVTRIGDQTAGVCDLGLPCCSHGRSGTNGEGSPSFFVNGRPVHRIGDTGSTNCPHGGTFESVQGSPHFFVNGKPVTRIGDQTICKMCGKSGAHSTGSPNYFVGG